MVAASSLEKKSIYSICISCHDDCVILHKFSRCIPSSLFGLLVVITMTASSHPEFHPFTAIAFQKQKLQHVEKRRVFPYTNVTIRKYIHRGAFLQAKEGMPETPRGSTSVEL